MIRSVILGAVVLSAVSGCKTTPAEPVLEPMGEAQFASALRAAKADINPYYGEKKLSLLVDNETLAPDQRARALYARAGQRWKKTADKAGAKADFDEYVRLYPDATFANNAKIESGYVFTEMRAAESRLQSLQTLRDWFDDTWSLGKWDDAAARYRRSGLTPEPHQVYALHSTGYLCEGSGAKKLYNYGALTAEIQNLYWCK